jgi:tetratricopeptide (TPR) repeat protein/transcriptional regulator with XRE-family HTH domain
MNISDKAHFKDLLRQERIRRNWRQRDVADQVGTTVVTANRWESGIQQPSAYFRLKLCTLFGKSAEELGLVETNLQPSVLTETEEAKKTPSSSPENTSALWTIPYRRNPYFTGRDELLQLLDQHLSEAMQEEPMITRRAALTQPQAIKGLGGIGKTQIAVEYAYRACERGQYTHTLWINASSKEAVMTSFAALAELLPEFPAKNETDQQKLLKAIKRWLEQCKQRWLLIFDNADDLSLLQEYLPQSGNGSILVTTRASAVGSLAVSIDVEKMGFIEGTHLLLRRAQRFAQASDEEVNEAGNIVVALDHFPLALEQAGAYIEEIGCNFGNYLQLYQNHRKALLARRGAQATNYPDSVATTWSLSFQKVEQANPAAAELLRLCAFLAPDHIPEELLKDGAQHWPPMLQQAVSDPFTFDQMLEALLTFSLVKRLAENHFLSIHRLVQIVQMDTMSQEEHRQWAERVVLAVNAMFPLDPSYETAHWPQCLRYLEQAQTCNMLIQLWKLTLTQGADLLYRTAIYLYEHGSYDIAEALYQQALHIRVQSLGSEHHLVASSLTGLAILYRQKGNYTEAEPLFQRALHIWKQSIGLEHTEAAAALNGLAVLYYTQGKYTEAEALHQQALCICEQNLAADHPQLASVLHNLAILYHQQGKYTKAEVLFLQALHIREQNLAVDHPQLASAFTGLATIYVSQGKYTEAEPLYQRALHIWEQNLGTDHSLVAYPLNNLAELYREQGRYTEAEPLYQKALHIWEQNLGTDHSLIAHSLDGLATLYSLQKQYTEAKLLYQRALRIREQSLGSDHPLVASTLTGLATLYLQQENYDDAKALFQRALRIWEQQESSEHPEVARTLNNLASLYNSQGKYEEAEQLFQRALLIREQVLVSQHPDIAETLHNLARLKEALGNNEDARVGYTRALSIREQSLGAKHLKTTETHTSLTALLHVIGHTEEIT